MTITELLERALAHTGWSQRKMADFLGVREATVSAWKTGKQTPGRAVRKVLLLLSDEVNSD